jgi:uncharacterized protein (DUF983 family)
VSEILCPKCGSVALGGRTTWRDSKPYCSVCGWNLERAKEKERSNLKQLPIALLTIGFVLGMMAYSSASGGGTRVLVPIFAVILAIAAYTSWKNLKTLKQSQQYVKATPDMNLSQPPSANAVKNRIVYDRLLILNKPRRTKLKTSSLVVCTIFVIIIVTVLYFLAVTVRFTFPKTGAANTFANVSSLLLFGLIASAITGTTVRAVFRDRRLLAHGDIAIAVITSQNMEGGKSKNSYIRYEFKDMAGRMWTGKGNDASRELYEDMQTPVFYNPERPSENVTLVNATLTFVDF